MNLLSVSTSITSRWAGFYTRKLPAAQRDDRLSEIESDLWEHASCGRHDDRSEADIAFEILLRMLKGVPADLLWRRTVALRAAGHRAGTAPAPFSKGATDVLKRVLIAVANAIAVAGGAFLIINALGSGLIDGSEADMVFFAIEALGGLMLIIGVFYARSSPRIGAWLMVGGALLTAVWHFWAWFLFVPPAMLVIVGAIAGLQSRRPAGGAPA